MDQFRVGVVQIKEMGSEGMSPLVEEPFLLAG
jgi:hypothetical protein